MFQLFRNGKIILFQSYNIAEFVNAADLERYTVIIQQLYYFYLIIAMSSITTNNLQ